MIRINSVAWLQLTHKKSRLIICIIGVAFSVALMFITMGLRDGVFEDAVTLHKALQADLIIQPYKIEYFWGMQPRTFPRRILYRVSSINGVASVNPFYFTWGDLKNPNNLELKAIAVFAFKLDRPVFNLPEVNQQIALLKKSDTFLVDRLSRPGYGPIIETLEKKGTYTAELSEEKIKIVGFFNLGGGILSANGSLITSDVNYSQMFGEPLEKVHLGFVNLEKGVEPERIKKAIAEKLPKGVEVLTKEEFKQSEKDYWKKGSPIGFIFNILATIGLIFGIIIVYQILFTQITDYLSIYATIKAVGYTNMYIINTVIQEGLMMSILGYIPGFVMCLYIYDFIKDATRLPITMTFSRALTVLFLTIAMCSVAGVIAIGKLRDADPADLFR
ncbi:MAG: ABC transporter permease DevC [Xenococcaceae cyanobacterium]